MRAVDSTRRPGDRLAGIARVALILGVPSLGGCAVSIGNEIGDAYTGAFRTEIVSAYALSAEEQQQLSRMQTYSVDTAPSHTPLGQLKGLSCRETLRWVPEVSELNGRTPEEVAMTQLKVKVLKVGGNAILSATCSNHSVVDWGNNCFASWICTGEAIRVEQ
jgi:hypothetical protein